jgi:hypothetical protein
MKVRRFDAVFLLVLAALLMTACMPIPAVLGGSYVVRGSGSVIAEDRPVSGFDRVSLRDIGLVILTQGDQDALTVETDDNLLPFVRTEVRNGTLVLSFGSETGEANLRPSHGLKYYLTVQEIAGLEVADAGNLQAASLEVDHLEIIVRDSGDLEVDWLEARTLEARISDSGDARLAGQVQTQDLTVRDSGDYIAGDLHSQADTAVVSDSGEATLWTSEVLDVTISDSGDVNYYGHPRIRQRITDSGKLTRSLGE